MSGGEPGVSEAGAARVARVGLSPMKGTRHLDLEQIALDGHGPVGDRRWCLVDPQTRRVLRTVQNPALLRFTARETPAGLEITPPQGAPVTVPAGRTGDDAGRDSTGPGFASQEAAALTVDYWGRPVHVETLPGPVSELFSRHLGREVLLARAPRGEVVYGEQVTLLYEASLAALAEHSRTSQEDLWHRFRPTAVIASDAPPFAEEGWRDRQVKIGHSRQAGVGSCRLLLGGPVPRCAVIDINPVTGERDGDLLKTLALRRPLNGRGEPSFGIFATVLRGGLMRPGDEFAF